MTVPFVTRVTSSKRAGRQYAPMTSNLKSLLVGAALFLLAPSCLRAVTNTPTFTPTPTSTFTASQTPTPTQTATLSTLSGTRLYFQNSLLGSPAGSYLLQTSVPPGPATSASATVPCFGSPVLILSAATGPLNAF